VNAMMFGRMGAELLRDGEWCPMAMDAALGMVEGID
jgi:hypothetical protein